MLPDTVLSISLSGYSVLPQCHRLTPGIQERLMVSVSWEGRTSSVRICIQINLPQNSRLSTTSYPCGSQTMSLFLWVCELTLDLSDDWYY